MEGWGLAGGRPILKSASRRYELRSSLPGKRTRFPIADRSAIDGGHRHDFHAGVREKAFVGPVQLVDGIATFFDVYVEFPGQPNDDVSGDAVE